MEQYLERKNEGDSINVLEDIFFPDWGFDYQKKKERFYFSFRLFGIFWIKTFFKEINVRGFENIPEKAPVIFAINHPNNLIDSVIIGYVVNRKINYLATGNLFRNKQLARFLKSLGVIPVYRREDVSADKSGSPERNIQAFQSCYEVLEKGGVIGIYPEGTTHSEQKVQKIKTGAARITLEAEEKNKYSLGVKLIPVGINFKVRKSFRQNILVSFGEPIQLDRFINAYKEDKIKGVELLTEELQKQMSQQIVHVEKIDHVELIKDIESIYKGELIKELEDLKGISKGDVDELRLGKKIVEVVNYYDKNNHDKIMEIWEKISHYKRKLKKLKLQDQLLQNELKKGIPAINYFKIAGFSILTFPVAIYGIFNNFLSYWLPKYISRKISRKETDYATTKLIVSLFTFPLFYLLQIFLFWRVYGIIPAAIYGISLPVTGIFALKYSENLKKLAENIYYSFLILTKRNVLIKMKGERKKLISDINKVKDEYLASVS